MGGGLDGIISKRTRLLTKLVIGVGLAATLALSGFVVIKEKLTEIQLYNEVRSIANTNKDNITDAQEWAKVYESFGLTYDIHYSDPKRDLSLKEMREYLGKE